MTDSTVFRPVYRKLDEQEQGRLDEIKNLAQILLEAMAGHPVPVGYRHASRELSLAQTKLEESVMWAVKHWTA